MRFSAARTRRNSHSARESSLRSVVACSRVRSLEPSPSADTRTLYAINLWQSISSDEWFKGQGGVPRDPVATEVLKSGGQPSVTPILRRLRSASGQRKQYNEDELYRGQELEDYLEDFEAAGHDTEGDEEEVRALQISDTLIQAGWCGWHCETSTVELTPTPMVHGSRVCAS